MKSQHVLTLTIAFASIVAIAILNTACQAQTVEVSGGVTSIDFDEAVLGPVGFTITRVSEEVTSPRGTDFLGFAINSRDDAINPTTFEYEASTLTPVAGIIESSGSIFFNEGTANAVEIGDIQLGFDQNRITGINSGFFARSTAGTFTGVVFDIGLSNSITAEPISFAFQSDIFISPEFAAFLPSDFTGANVGLFAIDANAIAVPEPTGLGCFAIFGITMSLVRRRKSSI